MLDQINNILGKIDNFVWGVPLIVLILLVGIFLTIRLKGLQIRKLPLAVKYLFENEKSGESGEVSSFAALCTALSATIGTGNIVGVATALVEGGPGALFWMWIAALVGTATKYSECLLAIKYRVVAEDGHIIGGPFYYIEKGMGPKWKWLGKLFAFFGVGVGLFGIGTFTQINGITSAVKGFFDPDTIWTVDLFGRTYSWTVIIAGIILTICVALVIIGGIKRISTVSQVIVPFMALTYVVVVLIIIVMHITEVPAAFATIIKSAFGFKAVAGGAMGSIIVAMQKGIARGIFSNEAGLGSAPIAAAAVQTDYPVKQGLVQGLSVYIDTLLVCTCTGISILLAGTYNVAADGAGASLLVEHVPGIQYGIAFMQEAMSVSIGKAGAMFLAIMLFIFIFTTMLSYSYQLESTCKYLFGENKMVVTIVRILFLVFCMFGILIDGDTIWPMGDIGVGCMLWVNTFSILLLTPKVLKIVKDYEKQKNVGLNPLFDPATVGIEDKAGVWDTYVKQKKERGDYENPQLGYDKK